MGVTDVAVVEEILLVEAIVELGDDVAGHDELRPFTQYLSFQIRIFA